MELPPGLAHVLAETHLFTDGMDYVILGIAPTHSAAAHQLAAHITHPFLALLRDKDEFTLVLPLETWEPLRPTLQVTNESPAYRLITFDLPLDLGLVGYIATLAGTLSEQGISIFPISAFSRDHILVPAEDFEQAWDTLRDFVRACQEQNQLP